MLSILFSTAISLIFKVLSHKKADNLQAIFWNYCTCVACSLILKPATPVSFMQSDWSVLALLSGLLFIAVFLLMARTAQEYGVSVSVVSSKMAVIFPVAFGIFIAGEKLLPTTTIGILLSVISVWLVTFSGKEAHRGKHMLIPVAVFVGSGIIDALLKFISWRFQAPDESALSMHIFSGAAISGFIYLLYKKRKFTLKNIKFGILLGIPNFFSIYFLLKAIADPGLPAVVMFPVNNIGVVLLGTLLSWLIWKEEINRIKFSGILLAILSIVLISLQLS